MLGVVKYHFFELSEIDIYLRLVFGSIDAELFAVHVDESHKFLVVSGGVRLIRCFKRWLVWRWSQVPSWLWQVGLLSGSRSGFCLRGGSGLSLRCGGRDPRSLGIALSRGTCRRSLRQRCSTERSAAARASHLVVTTAKARRWVFHGLPEAVGTFFFTHHCRSPIITSDFLKTSIEFTLFGILNTDDILLRSSSLLSPQLFCLILFLTSPAAPIHDS